MGWHRATLGDATEPNFEAPSRTSTLKNNPTLPLQAVPKPPATMYCCECGTPLPSVQETTICTKCKTPLSTWWDVASRTYRTNRESILPDNYPTPPSSKPYYAMESLDYLTDDEKSVMGKRRNESTEEERNFNAALIVLEMHFERSGNYMRGAMGEVKRMVAKTLDLSLNKAEVRYV